MVLYRGSTAKLNCDYTSINLKKAKNIKQNNIYIKVLNDLSIPEVRSIVVGTVFAQASLV